MRCSNVLFVVFFLAVILFQISQCVLGYWAVGVYILVILAAFHFFQSCLRYCRAGNGHDFPNLFLLLPGNAYSNLMDEPGKGQESANDSMTTCLVCNELSCDKHDPSLAVHLQPWKHLLVDAKVNAELEELFNFLLEQHTPWLSDVSHNSEEIRLELKRLIRLVASSLLLRVKGQLQWNEIIFKKLPKYLTHHLEMYIYGKRKAKSARFLEESVLREYGHLLHPAVVNSSNEAKYLKSIANLLLHTSLPCKLTKCEASYAFLNEFISSCIFTPLIDILIDPDKINTFLIFLFDKNENAPVNLANSVNKNVEFLSGLVDTKRKFAPDHFGIEKVQIFEDQHLLFLFSQFAKEEHFLNVLQFVLHMNQFMNQIINPDLTDDQLQSLHQRLANVYELYLIRKSKDYIPFEPSIVASFAKAVNSHYDQIQQFRNSKSLYEAYEYANEILEFYCHKFFHTDVYLKLICGQRSLSFTAGYEEYCEKEKKKIPDPNLFDGTLFGDFDNVDSYFLPDDVKDLSLFNVNILSVNTRFDTIGREAFYFEMETIHPNGPSWVVERQFSDFFSIATKLREFHGEELDEFLLPTRKFLRANKSLMESYRYDLELFLRDLLNNETLKRSELVYNFLTADEFSYGFFGDNFNFGKMIKNVPSKFSKERGQHLYSFISRFIDSCASKNSSTQEEDGSTSANSTESMEKKQKRRHSSRVDSESFDLSNVTFNATSTDRLYSHLEYLYDQVLLILVRFYTVNKWIMEILFMARPLLRQSFQAVCEYLVTKQLQSSLLTPTKMCQLIGDLRRLLQQGEESGAPLPGSTSLSNLTKSQRSQKALKVATEFVPRWLVEQLVDYNQHEHFVFLLFSLLQHRLLNKQLLFLLVNSLIADLFPEPIYQTID